MATLQVPVLFDMSGDTIIFGEAAGADFVTAHLDFTLDMTTQANDISLNAADISGAILVGDHETSDGIFYSGNTDSNIAIDTLCNRISKAITRGKLVHIPKTGNTANSGITMGGRSLRNANGNIDGDTAFNIYAPKYDTSIAPIGDEQMLGGAMGRVACVHLVGHPLSAAIFSDPTQIQTDVETDSGQTFNSGGTVFYNALAVQLSKVLGGSKATNPLNGGTAITQSPVPTATLLKTMTGVFSSLTKMTTDGTYIYHKQGSGMPLQRIKISDGVEDTLGTVPAFNSRAIHYHDGYVYYRHDLDETNSIIGRINTSTGAATDWKTGLANTTYGGSATTAQDVGGMTTDSSGNLWCVTQKALFKVKISDGTLTNLLTSIDATNHLLENNEGAIVYAPSKGMLYIVGRSNKLVTVDPVSGAMSQTISADSGYVAPNNMGNVYNSAAIDSGGEYLFFASSAGPDNVALTNKRLVQAVKLSDYSLSTWFTSDAGISAGLVATGGQLYIGDGNTDKLNYLNDIASTAVVTYPFDASGVSNIALKSVFEQLMNIPGRSQIMQTRDITGQPINSDLTFTGGFPVITGDKLVLYIRPKIQFAALTEALESTILQAFPNRMSFKSGITAYNVGAAGTITGQVYTESSWYDAQSGGAFANGKSFDGGVTGDWGWLSAKTYADDYGKGDYIGSASTALAQGGIVSGEWIQVSVGQSVGISQFTIVPQNKAGHLDSIGGRSPYVFRLLTSDNAVKWKIIERYTVGSNNADTSNYADNNTSTASKKDKTFVLPNPVVGKYFRLVIEKIYQGAMGTTELPFNKDGACAIQELILTGAKFPLEIDTHSDKAMPTEAAMFDISGVGTNVAAIAANIETVFPGNVTTGDESEESKWGWMGSANSDSLSLETTDETDVRTCDLHIWKVTITL